MTKRKLETLETSEEGNTKPPQKRCVPSKRWCFTFNNYDPDDVETLETNFKSFDIEYIFGEEVGEKGTPHLQGYIECPIKIRPIEKLDLNKSISWRRAKGNKLHNINYCSKDGKFYYSPKMKPPRQLKLIEPRGWQLKVLDIIKEEPDDRTIHWYWDNGGTGKTSLCKYLIMKHEAIVLGGKATDIKNGILTYYNKEGYTPDLIVVNITRSMEQFVSYEGLENIKDMMFYSGKYEGGQICGPSPHLIVFANFEPDKTKLTNDRWKITELIQFGHE